MQINFTDNHEKLIFCVIDDFILIVYLIVCDMFLAVGYIDDKVNYPGMK